MASVRLKWKEQRTEDPRITTFSDGQGLRTAPMHSHTITLPFNYGRYNNGLFCYCLRSKHALAVTPKDSIPLQHCERGQIIKQIKLHAC